jgi:hypothetical protein
MNVKGCQPTYQRHCTTRLDIQTQNPAELSGGVVQIFGASENIPQVQKDVKRSSNKLLVETLLVYQRINLLASFPPGLPFLCGKADQVVFGIYVLFIQGGMKPGSVLRSSREISPTRCALPIIESIPISVNPFITKA